MRDIAKAKQTLFDCGGDESISISTDYEAILKDESINSVLELMGGVTPAKYDVFVALEAGKHVITASKALLAAFLPEIIDLLAQHPSAKLCFEAAVCGGIPIVRS